MKTPHIKKIHTLIGILLMAGIFVLPIYHSSVNHYASAEGSNYSGQIDSEDLARVFYKEKIEQIDSFMQTHHNRFNFQGNVLVAYKGNRIYEGTFGYETPRRKKPMGKDAVFQLASVSKQFTAMATMIAIEKEILNYQDTITEFFPQFPYEGITVQMLLNHTAGLPNYMWLLEHHWNDETIPYNDDVIDLMAKHKLHLYFRPGTRFDYSNTGYVILAALIEKATGKRFDKYLEQEIFEPLGMKNSYVHSASYKDEAPRHLDGYKYWGRGYRRIPATVNDGTVGDKGIYSTMIDLYRWDKALYENTLVSEKTMQKAFEAVKLKNGNHYPYGFGFRLREREGKKVVYHYGKWNGFRTGIIRYIEDTSTIIILNHTDRPYNSRITKNIHKILNTG
jgi:CubicO group peptidase (beta-lactamase class C family)